MFQSASRTERRTGAIAHPTLIATLLGLLGGALVFGITVTQSDGDPSRDVVIADPITVELSESGELGESDALAIDRQAIALADFYDAEVTAAIGQADAANHAAADRCVERIEALFDRYRGGIEPFADELLGWKTRFGILRRLPGAKLNDDDRVEAYVSDKFHKHLFSTNSLQRDLSVALIAFQNDVAANQRRMLIAVNTSLSESSLPSPDAEMSETFFDDRGEALLQYARTRGITSVTTGVMTIVGSEAGAMLVTNLVASLVGRVAASTAIAGTAAGGSTVAASGTGGVAGTAGGPVGTGIGLAVGFVIGAGIDYYMTEKFSDRLQNELGEHLDVIERRVLFGSVADRNVDSSIGNGGLSASLDRVCVALEADYRQRFYEQLVGQQLDGQPVELSEITSSTSATDFDSKASQGRSLP